MKIRALMCSPVCSADRVKMVKIVLLACFSHIDERNPVYIYHGLSYRILSMMKKRICIIMLKLSVGQISNSLKACCSQDN